MTYNETCDYLYSQTNFETQGTTGYKEGIETMQNLDAHFSHPHRAYRTIHIAGTNGKGSCSHTLSAILQMCGYKVGLYTSPHLMDFSERIRINGQPIPENYVTDFVEKERNYFEQYKPTFFEITTIMALKYFEEQKVDIAIIEVGLGGRLDSTNIITPILSVITNISKDHTELLGDSLEQIAIEKAGIIKKGVPVVIGETVPETRAVFEAVAAETKAPITFAEDEAEVTSAQQKGNTIKYTTRHYGEINSELTGIYQKHNTNTVLAVIRKLEVQGLMYRYPEDSSMPNKDYEIREAFANVTKLTGLKGRWQQISQHPTVVCDTGHNVGGWTYISQQLNNVKCDKMHIIFGLVDDKDLEGILSLLPQKATYYFTKANTRRALSEKVLKMLADAKGLEGKTYEKVEDAWNAARENASDGDFIFVGGSNYIVGEFLRSLT